MHSNLECPDRMENGIEALVDMYLLAACDYLVVDEHSSFSYVASLLTNAPDSNVFNVQRGGNLPPDLRRLIWRLFLVRLRLLRSKTKRIMWVRDG